MKRSKLGRVGMRIGALVLSVCLFVCTEGMDVWATGMNEEVPKIEMNVGMEEVEALAEPTEVDTTETEIVETDPVKADVMEVQSADDNLTTESVMDLENTTEAMQIPVLTEKDKFYKPYEDATYELWYYENEDGIEIKGISGTASGKLVIPDKIEGKVVNKIGDYAFASYSEFTGTLDIPDTIEYIGENAFSSCSGLTGDLFIPKSVEILSDFAFKGCTGFDGKLTISEGVTSIGYMTFSRCRGLKGDLVIPKGVTSIGAEAFYECSGLEGDLIIGEGVTSIGKNAFRYSGFKGTLTLPESLVTVEQQAFEDVAFTGDLTIPGNVKKIEKYGFEGLRNITGTLKVSGSIEEWDELAFHYGGYSEIIIEEGVTSIPKNAFAYCKNAEKITLPNSLTTIGYGAFQDCDSLKSITIPGGVISIGNLAFFSCDELEDVIISDGVTMLGNSMFSSCNKLSKVIIPNSVISMGEGVFSWCKGLEQVIIPNSVTVISNYTFQGCTSLTGVLEIPEGVTSIGDYAYRSCSGLNGKIRIPVSVKSIGKEAFKLTEKAEDSPTIIIYGKEGSYAETYAEEQGYGFVVDQGGEIGKYPLPDTLGVESSVTLGEYWVIVLDNHGEPVTDAQITVQFLNNGNLIDYVYEDGIVKIPVDETNQEKGIAVYAKKSGMEDASAGYRITKGGSSYLKMRKESIDPYIESVMIEGMQNMYADVTRHHYVVYKSDADKGKMVTFRVMTAGDTPGRYELVQGERVIVSSTSNLINVNLAKELELGGPMPVIIVYDRGNRRISEKKVLFTAVEMDEKLVELTKPKISIGSKFTFSIGDVGIPILSESEFNVDTLVKLPVKCEIDEDTVKIEIGNENFLEKGGSALDNFKKKVLDLQCEKTMAKYHNTFTRGFFGTLEPSIQAFGYGEAKFNDNSGDVRVDVAIYVKFTCDGIKDYTWYSVIGPIPVYLKTGGEFNAQASAKTPIVWSNGSFVLAPVDIDTEVAFTMGAGGGVGLNDVACIDGMVNVTGTWKHNSYLTLQALQGSMHSDSITVHGSGKLRAVLLMFEWSREWPAKTVQILPKKNVLGTDDSFMDMNILNPTDYQLITRDYLLDNGSLPILKSNGDDTQVIINGLYPDAKPKLVTYKGADYLFYLDDQKDRGLEDRTALVYRKEVNGVFGEPVIVEDDKTGDFDYDVKAVEDGIYVLWQDGNKSLQGITTLEEAAEALTLSVAKVTDKGVTLLEAPDVTEGLAPISPILVDTGKEIKACWYENSSNDLLQSGQGTSRFYGQAVGAKGDKQKIGETVRTITTTDFGMIENALSVAYTVDEDNDISTVEDREIYVASKGEVKRLTDNDVADSNALFGTVAGKQVLVYYSDKNLACTDGKTTELLLDAEDSVVTNGLLSDDFQFVSESANPAIVWKDAYWMGEEAGQGMTMLRFKDGSWGKPVRVAGTTDSLVAYSVLEKTADTLRVVYTAKGEEAGKEITRLMETEGRERASIGLVRISYEQEDYVSGENLPFSVTLQNTGALRAEDYEITVLNEAGETIFTQKGSEAIPAGEEKVITLANFSPADSGDLQTLRIQVNGDGRKQDAMDFTLGGADLSLRTDISYDEDDRILNLQMINGSNLTENMKLTITDTKEAVLYEKEYEAVPGKSSVNYLCKLDKFFEMTEADSIKLKLESMGRTETYLFDNETTLYRPGSVTKITEVTLEQKEMELTSGDTAQLKVTTDGEGTVLYESNNPDCVSVSDSGVVKAKAPGSATVTAYTEDGGRAICIITVKEATPSKPSIVLGDVEESSWQYKFVKYACENDYMKGKKTDEAGRILFDPEGTLTRAEFVQVLYNAEGKPAVTYKDRFSDVPENQWYTNAIIWATEKGIVNGYGNGKYGVSDSITREQLATMLNKYAQYKGYKTDATAELDTYTDTGKISGWAVNYMKWIVGSSIMSGKGDRLDPQGNATRAECATLVNKFHICYGE